MASIRRYNGKWRAEIARGGARKSKTFATKTEAKDWAAREEMALLPGSAGRTRLADVLTRYAREVSPAKRGARWEMMRLERMCLDPIGAIAMRDLSQEDFAAWRDRRLREVAPGTVRREMNLLSHVMTIAIKEWRMIRESPIRGVRKPQEPPRRERLPTAGEVERLLHVAGDDLSTGRARAVQAFLFSIETGMRAGEVTGLTWANIDLVARVAHLALTKNGSSRDVPLSKEAVRILEGLPKSEPVFGLTSRQLDAHFRAMTKRAGIKGLTYHDSRHAAVTRLSRVLEPLALAKMIGHRDLSMLLRYFDESAADIARRLD